MKVWLDDIRDPQVWHHIGWVWAKTADEAIELLSTGKVTHISLDHDLDIQATIGNTPTEKTGYDVICWMEEHNVWPSIVKCHSSNPAGRARIEQVIRKYKG